MNVWVRLTRRRVKCFYCSKMIETDEYQVVCRYYLKRGSRTWTKDMHFHAKKPNCWLDRAIAELESRPAKLETRGRKADVISDEHRILRQKILRRRASVMQRINCEMETLMRPGKLMHLTELLEGLVTEIEPYGGVPKSWK